MNGVLILDKPEGITSFRAVSRMRGITKEKKVGHAGTLDPLATGVLPIFFGSATRACDLLPETDKRYLARFCFGFTTDTDDMTGKVINRCKADVSLEQLQHIVSGFLGPQLQLPPIYSAIKIGGKPMYKLARAGEEPERKPRPVEIKKLEITGFGEDEAEIDVLCSKGTYVRALARDIGDALGCGAALGALRRTEACGFKAESAVSIDEAEFLFNSGKLEEHLVKTEDLFSVYPATALDQRQSFLFSNGAALDKSRLNENVADGICRVFGNCGLFLGLGIAGNGELKVLKRF